MPLITRERPPEDDADGESPGPPRGRVWRRLAPVLTVAAALLVIGVLVFPVELTKMVPAEFLRLPLEALVGLGVLVLLPARARRWTAIGFGILLGLLALIKIFDLGFLSVVARPFDPALDWVLFDDAFGFLRDSMGRAGAIAVAVLAILLMLGIPALLAAAVLRLSGTAARHRGASARTLLGLGAVWIVCSLLGAQLAPGVPLADHGSSALVTDRVELAEKGFQDQEVFAKEASVDAFRNTPPEQLLTGLRGKDVVIAIVESYGRDAISNPDFAPQVGPFLDGANARLTAAGYGSRSGFLTSSTLGSGSGLAHATLLSGLWTDSNRRWRQLVSSDRITLTGEFQKAGWRTVAMMPGNTWAWPEGKFYHFDQVYDARNMGYRGPTLSWSNMPDQYTMLQFEQAEHARKDRAPLLAQIVLTSSHAPWAPVPDMVGWDQVGDGSVYGPMVARAEPVDSVWSDPKRVREEYRRSIVYSLDSLYSWIEKYGNDNLVVVVFGDHQPLPIVTSNSGNRDVPISIIAKDRKVLDRIGPWGWQDGLKPGPNAPLWRMDAFRDRFLTAYGPPERPAH